MSVAGAYRPHIRLVGSTLMLGVVFEGCDQRPIPTREVLVEVRPGFDGVDYSGLSVGAPVEVVEGDRVVARGRVIG